MKELYIAPEAKLLGFAPVENLANSNVTLDQLLGGELTIDKNIISNENDVDVMN